MIALARPTPVQSAASVSRPALRLDRRVIFFLAAVLVVAYTLTALSVLNRRVARQQQVTGHSFVISDLFPRWYGAQAMLKGVSPYSEEFRADLHREYYGATHSREWERDTFRNIAEFFYPPYVLLPLLPLLWLPFEAARWLAGGATAAAIAAATLIWARYAGLRLSRGRAAVLAVSSLVFYPSLDAITLQQLTGLVYLYVVGAVVLAGGKRHVFAGVALALAMIKPQSALIPAACLLFWSLWRRDRWTLPLAFGITMLCQVALAQWLVPDWIAQFLAANARYREFNTIGFWLPGQLLGGPVSGWLFAAGPLTAFLLWRWFATRHADLTSPTSVRLTALSLVSSIILMPDISYYNKIFLLPALVLIILALPPPGSAYRLARRFAALATWIPLFLFGAVGLLSAFAAPNNVIGLLYSAIATMSEAHFLLLPALVLPAAAIAVQRAGSDARGGLAEQLEAQT